MGVVVVVVVEEMGECGDGVNNLLFYPTCVRE